MHKSNILGLSLVVMLFLATTMNMSKPISAMQVSTNQASADPPTVLPPELTDEQIICEECVKYWLHFLNAAQTGTLLNALINAINFVNFDSINCVDDTEPTVSGATCLTTGSPDAEYNTAQLFDICKNLELALDFLVTETVTPVDALKIIEDAVLLQTNTNIDRVVRGLFDCFEKALLPVLFPPPPETCQECFTSILDDQEEADLATFLAGFPTRNLDGYCAILDQFKNEQALRSELDSIASIEQADIDAIVDCLRTVGTFPPV